MNGKQVKAALDSFTRLFGEGNVQIVMGDGRVGFEDLSGVSTGTTWLSTYSDGRVHEEIDGVSKIWPSMEVFTKANEDTGV